MALYQTGIVADANPAALFLTFNQTRSDGAQEKVKAVLSKIPALELLFNQSNPGANLHIVAAIGSAYWSQLNLTGVPSELQPFPSLENGEMIAPNTPVDLLFHIRSERKDLNFMLAQRLTTELGDAVELVEEVEGFRYLDSRDLTGFVDGTENPEGENRINVAVVGEEDPDFAGGSYIHLQRYVHNMPFWNKQPLKTQEDTIGRTKADNVEYASAAKAMTAHTKRTSLKDEQGRSIEILRHSMPYGDTRECGLLFASYCRSPENFTLMLKSMIEGDGSGHCDHLLKYTRAVTGQAFFAPSVAFLESL
ncbi:Dyp-type peroxidase [Neptuniibacter caesariensis]|uniref:Putative melanin biosynthesis protein TyrA n=1 Tax=Neptuniibacter caesariensis TaxID=207954 RepID=A0A7U8C8B7_NEPCE|nr:Dyp-type peroxidase [Neptuniibacter caesariensis]EAR62476.1 putative melanin biosynthesis protein TyrA [Oceanospirillum sp. MED92] [Neptuniibacter caesariensis]